MNILHQISEQKIQAALQHGDFENLSGAGKPIRWNDNLLAPEDKKLTFDLLQNNGFTLPWIEKGIEVRKGITKFRHSLREWFIENPSSSQFGELPTTLMDTLAGLNQKIIDYNRSVPVGALQVSFIDADRELELLRNEFPGCTSETGQT